MKNLLSRNFIVCITLFVALTFLLSSCSTSKGMHYNKHLKAKKSGFHHLTNDNAGCSWSK
jgi:hypothetical protein